MSNPNLARRTAVGIAVAGADITKSIQLYLESLIYTDNEADKADDLQLQLQDRDSIWMEKWLADIIDAAASTSAAASVDTQADDSETVYVVVRGDTLSAIAAKHGTTYQELAKVNGIANPNLIYPEQKIKIPGTKKKLRMFRLPLV